MGSGRSGVLWGMRNRDAVSNAMDKARGRRVMSHPVRESGRMPRMMRVKMLTTSARPIYKIAVSKAPGQNRGWPTTRP